MNVKSGTVLSCNSTPKSNLRLAQEGRMLHRSFEHGSGSTVGSGNKSGDWSDGWFDDEDDPQCQAGQLAAPFRNCVCRPLTHRAHNLQGNRCGV